MAEKYTFKTLLNALEKEVSSIWPLSRFDCVPKTNADGLQIDQKTRVPAVLDMFIFIFLFRFCFSLPTWLIHRQAVSTNDTTTTPSRGRFGYTDKLFSNTR